MKKNSFAADPNSNHADYVRIIRDKLVSPGSTLWFQIIDRKTKKRSPFILTKEYLQLFGCENESQLPRKRLDLVAAEDRDTVERTIRNAKSSMGQPFHCVFHARTITGRLLLLYAVTMKFRYNNQEILASWNTDITRNDEKQRFYGKILDTVEGFVFVKEPVGNSPEELKQEFVFRYVNKALADAFGLNFPDEVDGKRDSDYIKNQKQVEQFHRRDLEAFQASSEQRVNVAEEKFTSSATSGTPPVERRLATVKTACETSIFDALGRNKRYVLGIAIDITDIQALLLSVISLSREAIYIKDAEQKYILVNRAFRQQLQISEGSEIEGLTFREVMTKHHVPLSEHLENLIADVEAEDALVLTGKKQEICRSVRYNQSTEFRVHTIKQPIAKPGRPPSHILGVDYNLHNSHILFEGIFDRLTQCVCVKNETGEIVLCNEAYATRHRMSKTQIHGLTDVMLWPEAEFPGQATRYRMADCEVLRLTKSLQGKSGPERLKIEKQLGQFTDFPEDQLMHSGKSARLRTTKWAEKIGDEWLVFVVYSDFTPVHDFHRFTVHSFRNEIMPIETARDKFAHALREKLDIDQFRREAQIAQSFLRKGTRGLSFYITHLLKFLHGHLNPKEFLTVPIVSMLRQEHEDWAEMSYGSYTPYKIALSATQESESIVVLGAPQFLQATFKELLRNAWNAIYRRQSFEKRTFEATLATEGRIGIRIQVTHEKDADKCLQIQISDNGDCCVSIEAQSKLRAAWAKAATLPQSDVQAENSTSANLTSDNPLANESADSNKLGLSFLHWVIRAHGGTIVLDVSADGTIFSVKLPIKD